MLRGILRTKSKYLRTGGSMFSEDDLLAKKLTLCRKLNTDYSWWNSDGGTVVSLLTRCSSVMRLVSHCDRIEKLTWVPENVPVK